MSAIAASPFFSATSDLALTGSAASQRLIHPIQNCNNRNLTFSHQSNASRLIQGGSAISMPAQTSAMHVVADDVVLTTISGILYKWVNFGRGWRPRWFVLEDGVLSYYKIHGPRKIVVTSEMVRGSRIIGDKSMKLISRHSKHGNCQVRCKTSGEIHLKVSSMSESRSDDKKFSIFSGTTRLQLRAETCSDRTAWIEALKAAKAMFPRISLSERMAPIDDLTVSTEKLKQRLIQEGASEAAIRDSERIMLSEFAAMQNEMLLLKQKQNLLVDTLQRLEVHTLRSRKQHPRDSMSSPV